MFTEIIITHASCTVKEKYQQMIFWIFFSDLFQKTGFDIFMQTLFSERKKLKKIKLLSVEFVLSVVKVKLETIS